MTLRRMLLWGASSRWVRGLAGRIPGIRAVAWRYVAGENLSAAVRVIRALNADGFTTTLNYVGAHADSEREAIAAADEVIESLESIHAEELDSHVSVKLTQLGLDVDESLARTLLRRVVGRAADLDIFARIDMEESQYVERTIHLFEEIREEYGAARVGIAVQSYLRHRPTDLTRLLDAGSRVRLVKGGYWESNRVVYRARADIDRAFWMDMETLLERGHRPAIATHDAAAIEEARRITARFGLDKGAFEFQMLYGVRPDLQAALVREGYAVRCYVPYGGQWLPYVLGCVRRMPSAAVHRLRQRLGRRVSRDPARVNRPRRLQS
jgi:proline dehydrogenase